MPAKKYFGQPCCVDGCDKPAWSNDLCRLHARRKREKGDPLATFRERLPQGSTCRLCDKPTDAKGLCSTHYRRFQLTGDPGPAGLLRGPNGSGHINKQGYRIINTPGRRNMQEHRVIMEQVLGRRLFADETVHHINGVRHDNRIANLELWSKSQPAGQRVDDKVAWAKEILARYGFDFVQPRLF